MGKKPAPGYVFGSRVLRLSFGALSSKVDACSRKSIKLLLWSLLLFFFFFLFLPQYHTTAPPCAHTPFKLPSRHGAIHQPSGLFHSADDYDFLNRVVQWQLVVLPLLSLSLSLLTLLSCCSVTIRSQEVEHNCHCRLNFTVAACADMCIQACNALLAEDFEPLVLHTRCTAELIATHIRYVSTCV